jgi:hypothetical protein
MTPYLVQLLDITINNSTIPSDCKRAKMFPIYRGANVRLSEITDLPV